MMKTPSSSLRHALWLLALAAFLAIPLAGVASEKGADHFHHVQKSPKVDYDGFYAQAEPVGETGPGRELLEACFAAYGGREKLSGLKDLRLKFSAMGGDGEIIITRSWGQGRKHKFEQGQDTRILNGDDCWYTRGDQVAVMDGGRYRAELYSQMVLGMPLASETERFDGVRYGKREGDPLEYLYFDKADTVLVVLGISPEDHLIRTSTGVVRQGEQEFVFINELGDFKEVGGYLLPHSIANTSMGMKMGELKLEEAEINPGLGDSFFRPKGSDQ